MAEYVVGPGTTFEASYGSGTSGLVGTVEVAIIDLDNNVVFGPTAAGIIENVIGGIPTGVYTAELVAPTEDGQFGVVWSEDGTWDPINVSPVDQLIVAGTGVTPIVPGPPAASADTGPCSLWASVDDLAECCDAATASSDNEEALENHLIVASQILWELSGRRYSGACAKTVRPCQSNCSCWPFQRFTVGDSSDLHYLWTGREWSWNAPGWRGSSCGCGCTPRVLLSGYPVQTIQQVKINGDVVSPTTYRLDEKRYLTRRDGGFWPSCQNLALDDTEDGTWSITYIFGEGPPVAGALAATRLACELLSACTDGAECKLPSQAVRVVRQGITIDTLQPLARMLLDGSTGLVEIDSFIAAYGQGPKRRPAVWSPEATQYARPVGS